MSSITRSAARPSSLRRRGETADESRILGAFEQIAAGIVAGMHQHVGAGDALRKGARRRVRLRRRRRHSCATRRRDRPRRWLRRRCRGRADPRRRSHRRRARCRRCDRGALRRRIAACRPPPADFRRRSPSRAATACTAASISAICAGKRSRNSPEMRHVTSTRARPIAARRQHFDAGDAAARSAPRSAGSPCSANPCAISSPPVRSVALPHRSMTTARGISPCVCRCARTTSSAASRPRSIAVGVGSVRGSAVKRLRPVGSTSRRPRVGEPAGPAQRGGRQALRAAPCARLRRLPATPDRRRPAGARP